MIQLDWREYVKRIDYSNPRWAAIEGKRMSELTPEQLDDAHELWLRENLDWMPDYHHEHYVRLLKRIDALRGE